MKFGYLSLAGLFAVLLSNNAGAAPANTAMSESSSPFGCNELSGFASDAQKQVAIAQCKTLEGLYEYESKTCNLNVLERVNVGPSDITSLQYNLDYQCQGEVLNDTATYIHNWLKDGRSIPVNAVWFGLLDEERTEILQEVVADQDPDARCPVPAQPTRLEISENAIIFSGFYPDIDNQIQEQACDVGVLRPPMFLDAFIAIDGSENCRAPQDLAIRASQLLVLIEPFLKDTSDKQLAQKIWELFPKNYRELTFMAGYWWQPGWENIVDEQPFSWQMVKASEAESFDACLSPLYYHGEKDIPAIWYALYNHIDKTTWMTTNFRFQAGLWQADSLNYLADFYPSVLNDVWDEQAEAKAWSNLTVTDIAGIIAWANTAPTQIEECETKPDCPLINPIDTDKLPITDIEKTELKRKIEAAIAEYLK